MGVKQRIGLGVMLMSLAVVSTTVAEMIPIDNPGFEQTTPPNFFEFTFGVPVGWDVHDPQNIVPDADVFVGTLEPGEDLAFFSTTAPEGDLVAILFNNGQEGAGEYGYEQELDTLVQANTRYDLSVEVGNIGRGTAENGVFFNLDEFPGYRVELLAGTQVMAQDINSLSIPEREFRTSVVSFTTGSSGSFIDQPLGIRLVSLNEIPAGYLNDATSALEVDFDDVRLEATIPEPSAFLLLTAGFVGVSVYARRRRVDV